MNTADASRESNDFIALNPQWLALRTEAVLAPDLPIVDPHHHLWDHDGNRYLMPELLHDVGGGIPALDALPARVLRPVLLEKGNLASTGGGVDGHDEVLGVFGSGSRGPALPGPANNGRILGTVE